MVDEIIKDEKAREIVEVILADVIDRRGWRQEWEQFDEEVQAEVRDTWCQKIAAVL